MLYSASHHGIAREVHDFLYKLRPHRMCNMLTGSFFVLGFEDHNSRTRVHIIGRSVLFQIGGWNNEKITSVTKRVYHSLLNLSLFLFLSVSY